jgi:hypothetical protein
MRVGTDMSQRVEPILSVRQRRGSSNARRTAVCFAAVSWAVVIYGEVRFANAGATAWRTEQAALFDELSRLGRPELLRVELTPRRARLRGYLIEGNYGEYKDRLIAAIASAAASGGTGTVVLAGVGESECVRIRVGKRGAVVTDLGDVDDEEAATALCENETVEEILDEVFDRPKQPPPLPANATHLLEELRAALAAHGRTVPVTDPRGGCWAPLHYGLELLDELDRPAAIQLAEHMLDTEGAPPGVAEWFLSRSSKVEHLDRLIAGSSQLVLTMTHPERDAHLLAAFEPLVTEVVAATEAGGSVPPEEATRFGYLAWQLVGGHEGTKVCVDAKPLFERLTALGTRLDPLFRNWNPPASAIAQVWLRRTLPTIALAEIAARIADVDDYTLHYWIEALFRDHPNQAFETLAPRLQPSAFADRATANRAKRILQLLATGPKDAVARAREETQWRDLFLSLFGVPDEIGDLHQRLWGLVVQADPAVRQAVIRHFPTLHLATLFEAATVYADAALAPILEREIAVRPEESRKWLRKILAKMRKPPR